jgi:hypothetical protein
MTPEQLHILQHALGLDRYGFGESYRNHYVGGEKNCRPLVAMGYMIEMKPLSISGGDVWFMVTKEGKEAVKKESPKPKKMNRSQQRFSDYRDFDDAYPCTFKEFLQVQRTDWYQRLKAGTLPASSMLEDFMDSTK